MINNKTDDSKKSWHLQCFGTPSLFLFYQLSLLVSLPLSPMLTVSHVPSAQLMADIGLKSPTKPMLVLSNKLKHWDFLSLTVDITSHLFSITTMIKFLRCFQSPKSISRSGLKVTKHIFILVLFWYHKVSFCPTHAAQKTSMLEMLTGRLLK